MKIFLMLSLLVGVQAIAPEIALAQEGTVSPEIVEIRKSLPMEPTEKAVKDFILNRGSAAGLKAGAFVNVVRSVSVTDPVRNKALGALHVPVGKLQIIHVEDSISVARLYSELGNDERPMLEYEALMIGDQVDLNSITMDAPKPAKKKWFAHAQELETKEPTVEIAAVAVTAEAQASAITPANTTVTPPVTTLAVTPANTTVPLSADVTKESVPATQTAELSSVAPAPVQPRALPAKAQPSNEPAFIITPIEPSTSEAPVKEKTSFIPTEKATVSAAAPATSSP